MISDVKQLAPGAALDALVATRIMGWRQETLPDGYSYWCHPEEDRWTPLEVFKPSTSIADAWEIVNKLCRDGHWFDLWHRSGDGSIWWTAEFDTITEKQSVGPTAPHVICLAALKLVGALDGP